MKIPPAKTETVPSNITRSADHLGSRKFGYNLKLPEKLTVKSGTQIIDRCWRNLREHVRYTPRKLRNPILTRRIRLAQWLYWNRNKNLWAKTGAILKPFMSE